jgi:ABC-type spermidine/putrescine transport system permease subunit I
MPWWADVLAVIVVLGLFGAVGTALVFMGLTLAPLLHAHDYFLAVVIGVIIVLIPTLLIAGGQVPGVGSARTRGRNQT